MGRDGRVIAKRPALGLNHQLTESDERAIWGQMVQDYTFTVGLVVQGEIVPALHVLVAEHRFVDEDFVSIARSAPVVPKDRCQLIAKGLLAGFEGDFVTAVHILLPQLENVIRYHLKDAGALTTHLDQDGGETENGLSRLIELPEAQEVFGESLCFEIKAVFCSPFGPNLRNELVHGLLHDDAFNSVEGVYAWYLVFRLVFSTFWNAQRRTTALQPEQPAGAQEPVV